MTKPCESDGAAELLEALVTVVRSRTISLDDAWAVVAAVAPVLDARGKVEAWDEGYDSGHQAARAVNEEWPDLPPNPYRADAIEAEAGERYADPS